MSIEDDVRRLERNLLKLKDELNESISKAQSELTKSQKWDMSVWLFSIVVSASGIMALLLGFVFNSVAVSTAKDAAEGVAIDRISDRLRKDEPFIRDVQKGMDALPIGAVVAFTDKCKGRWRPYKKAYARFLVGAVEGSEEQVAKELHNNMITDFTPYRLANSGGEEKHILKKSEMPNHNHPGSKGPKSGVLVWQQSAEDGVVNDFGTPNGPKPGIQEHIKLTINVTSEGGGLPHENLPPYIAVHFCIKGERLSR